MLVTLCSSKLPCYEVPRRAEKGPARSAGVVLKGASARFSIREIQSNGSEWTYGPASPRTRHRRVSLLREGLPASRFPGMRAMLMSGYTANVIASHVPLDKDMNFVGKPFSVHELAVKVREALYRAAAAAAPTDERPSEWGLACSAAPLYHARGRVR